MGFFSKEECCICGGKAGLLTRTKLSDKTFICGNCRAKCSTNVDWSRFEKYMVKDDVLNCMEYTRQNMETFENEFHENDSICTGIMGGTKVILIDRNKGWWSVASDPNHDIFTFAQVASTELVLNTTEKSDEEKKQNTRSVTPPRAGQPTCPYDRKIDSMEMRVTIINHQWINTVKINVMNAFFVTEGDILAGYEAAGKIMDLFQSARYAGSGLTGASAMAAGMNYGAANAAPAAASSAADEIKKFKELLDMGVITEEEFAAKKRQLLGL